MDVSIGWWAALLGLAVAIACIIRKLSAPYALLLGAVVGCLVSGVSFERTVTVVVSGTQSVMGTVVRVLAAGVLAGVMMESGAATRIASTIVERFGQRLALLALACATMVICAVGVFIPVAVLIVAPIALQVGARMGMSKIALLVALSGGGKAGNIISPNPNTIAAASGFGVQASAVMLGSIVPALCGLAVAVSLATLLQHRGAMVDTGDLQGGDEGDSSRRLPGIGRSLVAPIVAVALLLINPVGSALHIGVLQRFQVDAMFILPFAAMVGVVCMGQWPHALEYAAAGLKRMVDVVLILIGAGAIGGLISGSDLSAHIVRIIQSVGISGSWLAPIAGVLMAAATASTSTGVILGCSSFGEAIVASGTRPLLAAVSMQAGATVIDALPHGNYFHVTAQSMGMSIGERMKVLPCEALVGLTMTIVAVVMGMAW